jgi:large subunit ribosomal protein L31
MKDGIHPVYKKCVVTCVCGNVFETRSSTGNLHIEICSNCHPFYTGKQKLLDAAGRVEKFNKKYAKKEPKAAAVGA